MVDRLHRVGRDPQAHRAAERVGNHRHVLQVRQKAALGLDVGVAHLVANLRGLGRKIAAPGHVDTFARKIAPKLATRSRLQAWSVVHFRNRGRIRGCWRSVKPLGLAKNSAKIPQKIRFFSPLTAVSGLRGSIYSTQSGREAGSQFSRPAPNQQKKRLVGRRLNTDRLDRQDWLCDRFRLFEKSPFSARRRPFGGPVPARGR